jgi:hypothetical protein
MRPVDALQHCFFSIMMELIGTTEGADGDKVNISRKPTALRASFLIITALPMAFIGDENAQFALPPSSNGMEQRND